MKNLALAYDLKKKNKKKMAEGGSVDESASSERRPMPDQKAADAKMVSRNSAKKAPSQDSWTDTPTEKQAVMNNGRKALKIKHPRMVPSDAFSVRLRSDEDDLQESAKPKLAEGGMINEEVSMHDAEEDMVEHPARLEEDDDQMAPAKDEFMADHFAHGGQVDIDEEEAIEHAASIASAIMARKKRLAQDSGSHDEDQAERYAEGGEIKSHDSIYSDDSDEVDLSRNADEDANEEDQLSFNALRKENYSESEGLKQLDSPDDSNEHADMREDESENKHDSRVVSAIRRKMRMKSPISR